MKIFVAFALFLFSVSASGQNLTKLQTIKYIKDKLNEAVGQTTPNGRNTLTITKNQLEYDEEDSPEELSYWAEFKLSNGGSGAKLIFFNPAKIVRMTYDETTRGSSIGAFTMELEQGAAYRYSKDSKDREPDMLTHMMLSFSQKDNLAYERITKAFLHLKSLWKVSVKRDPFAN